MTTLSSSMPTATRTVNFGLPGWPGFIAVAAFLLVISLAPFALFEYPALQDYLNHLARLYLLHDLAPDGWQSYWTINRHLVPNLALDIVCGWFINLGMSPNDALKLFCAITYATFVVGVMLIGAAYQRQPPWLTLWAFPLGFGLYFLYGLLNFYYSMGLSLWLVALWIWAHRQSPAARWGSASLVGATMLWLLVCHLMGYGVGAAIISMLELGWLAQTPKGQRVRRFFAQLPLVALATVPGLIFYALAFEHGDGSGAPEWTRALRAKAVGIVSPFVDYSWAVSAVVSAILLATVVVLWRRGAYRRTGWPLWAWLPVVGFLVLFLALPTGLLNSYLLDRRLFIVVVVLALALHPVVGLPRRVGLALVAGLCIAQAAKVASMSRAYEEQGEALADIQQVVERLPIGQMLWHLNFRREGTFPAPTLGHAGMLAVIDRAAHVPQLFAWPRDQEWVAYRDEDKIRPLLGDMMAGQTPAPWYFQCGEYDYLLITHTAEMRRFPPPGCMQEVARGEYYVLFKTNGAEPLRPTAADTASSPASLRAASAR